MRLVKLNLRAHALSKFWKERWKPSQFSICVTPLWSDRNPFGNLCDSLIQSSGVTGMALALAPERKRQFKKEPNVKQIKPDSFSLFLSLFVLSNPTPVMEVSWHKSKLGMRTKDGKFPTLNQANNDAVKTFSFPRYLFRSLLTSVENVKSRQFCRIVPLCSKNPTKYLFLFERQAPRRV